MPVVGGLSSMTRTGPSRLNVDDRPASTTPSYSSDVDLDKLEGGTFPVWSRSRQFLRPYDRRR